MKQRLLVGIGAALAMAGCGSTGDDAPRDAAIEGVIAAPVLVGMTPHYQPVAKVTVHCYRHGQLVAVDTDADGHFALSGLARDAQYELRFADSRYLLPTIHVLARQGTTWIEPPVVPIESRFLEVRLGPIAAEGDALSMTVSVFDPTSGAPIRGLDQVPGAFRGNALPMEGGEGFPIPSEAITVKSVLLPGSGYMDRAQTAYRLNIPYARRALAQSGILEIEVGFPDLTLEGKDRAPYQMAP
jgi:hypothetical protein